MKKDIYPLAIIGSGIAGMTASIYASRYQIKHLIVGNIPGGVMSESVMVENFPGFKSISGFELAKKIEEQVKHYKPMWERNEVIKIKEENNAFKIETKNSKIFWARFLLLAVGTKRRHLGVKGEEELVGKGVHYCVTCDGYFYKNKDVLVIGGGDAGVTAALSIADSVRKIYLLNNLSKLTAMPFWQKKLKQKKNVEFIMDNNVLGFAGKDKLEKVLLQKEYKGTKELKVDGVFIEIGSMPNTDLALDLKLKLDEKGFVKVSDGQQSSHQFVYACGDVASSSNHFHQMLTAASEGAVAVNAIYQEINKNRI